MLVVCLKVSLQEKDFKKVRRKEENFGKTWKKKERAVRVQKKETEGYEDFRGRFSIWVSLKTHDFYRFLYLAC
ncbi:hypothetical protein AGMMS49592_5340 [Endomicrobiia bacterium]|nr:hypothetical protein AGMMS49592_5310 [Endomicrobiia bacterium]GHT35153.1 hypothetical protein AGMMS49592_5340 [Endomicrobiia bacterium]